MKDWWLYGNAITGVWKLSDSLKEILDECFLYIYAFYRPIVLSGINVVKLMKHERPFRIYYFLIFYTMIIFRMFYVIWVYCPRRKLIYNIKRTVQNQFWVDFGLSLIILVFIKQLNQIELDYIITSHKLTPYNVLLKCLPRLNIRRYTGKLRYCPQNFTYWKCVIM